MNIAHCLIYRIYYDRSQKQEISVSIFGLINNQICYDAYG